jgi:DNA-binding Xre family transcriptional regulator
MYFEYDKLRGRMTEKGYTIRKLAQEIGVHENTLSHKLYSETYFTAAEILQICELLDIQKNEICNYFFMVR